MPERVHHSTRKARESDARVFATLVDYVKAHGYPPTVAELVDATKLTRGTVQGSLGRLRDRGVIRVEAKKARAITIVDGTS